MQLRNHVIGKGHPVFFIAEAGVNHNGNLKMALDLIDVAADAGADAVKFQTFKAEHIITATAPKAQYHVETVGDDATQSWYDLLKSQELDRPMHEAIIERCNEHGIMFMSTPYDEESVDLLAALDIEIYKIASTDANNIPFLEYIAKKGRPMILSTAMCNLSEIVASVAAIRNAGNPPLLVMQCTGAYPAPISEANLLAMQTIADNCNVPFGYSDHVPGTTAALAAIALGAQAYEKHFTLSRDLPGPDHRASLEPDELKALVRLVRDVESARGDGIKQVMPCEVENRQRLRKSLLSASALSKGMSITRQDIVIKRAGGLGLSPDRIVDIVGRKLNRDITAETPLEPSLFD